MKKSLFLCSLLALSCVSQVAAADMFNSSYAYNETAKNPFFNIGDAEGLTQNGDFAFSLNLPKTIGNLPNVNLQLDMFAGNNRLEYVGFSYVNGMAIYSSTNTSFWNQPPMNTYGLDDASILVFQINTNTLFTLSYYNSATGQLVEVVRSELSGITTGTVNRSEFILEYIGGAPIRDGSITTWSGTVTGDDISNYLAKAIYWVNNETKLSDVKNDSDYDATLTKTIALNGGTLVVDQEMLENVIISTSVAGATGGEIKITSGTTLNSSNISATSNREIKLSGDGIYYLDDPENKFGLGQGISISESWTGTVCTGDINPDPISHLSLVNLGNAQSCVQLSKDSDVLVGYLTTAMPANGTRPAVHVDTVKAPKSLTLAKDETKAYNLEVNGLLTLGTTDYKATLTLGGTLSLKTEDGLKLGNIASTATAAKIDTDSLNVTISDSELSKLPDGGVTILTLGEEFTGATTLNGTDGGYSNGGKLIYSLSWKTLLSKASANQWYLVLNSTSNSNYIVDALSATVNSHNGYAGMNLLNRAFAGLDPQTSAPGSALASLIDMVDAGTMTDSALAAAAGASTAVLGQALSGDTDRQLRAIRNRAISGPKGSDTITVAISDAKGATVSASQPATFSVWVNAEGNRAEQDADGTAAGYTLSSWGGTLGASMQVTPQLTLGLALTAMRGDLKSDGPDYLKGDMDTAYLSAFAHYQRGDWSHSFIGTVGDMEADYKRTALGYSNDGDTDGTAIGLMYELSREYTLTGKSSISPVFNVSYRHTEVDGYSERNTNAALSVDEQSLDTVTMGLGARYAATVGQRTMNRACAFEARALAKYDLGDRQTDTTVGFIGQSARANIESAEYGAFGIELGVGIAVPVGPGSIFADGSVELRSDYTNFNAAAGYRIQF